MRWKIPGIILTAAIIGFLVFVCNPLFIKHIDGSDKESMSLEEIYSRVRPYVKLEHMILTDSGYYTVTKNNEIQSRFYVGDLGDERYFVEISQKYLDAIDAADTLKDISLTVKLMPSDSIVGVAAASESMDLRQYQDLYDISSVAASQYRNNMTAVYIYYAAAVLLAIGIFCQKMGNKKLKNTKERQVDYEK